MPQKKVTVLIDELSNLIPDADSAKLVVDAVDLPKRLIKWEATPEVRWATILDVAEEHDKLVDLVERSVANYPKHRYLIDVAKGELSLSRGPDVEWKGLPFEAIIGRSDLLPIRFLAIGIERAACVGRIVLPGGLGSGFVIANDVMVTNHHVLPTAEHATTASFELGYEVGIDGEAPVPAAMRLVPGKGFATSEENDWSAVRIETLKPLPSIPLPPSPIAVGASVAIIQHPGGEAKQIALHHADVAFVSATRIQYFADTRAGSSGSPVFDTDWNLVAVHHSGGNVLDPGSTKMVQRNEGIAAATVIDGIRAAGLIGAM